MATTNDAPKTIPEVATELWELTTSYAKQETLAPLKGLARYLGYGLAGSLMLGIGVVVLLLSGLRFLQTETGTVFSGNLSWIPYLIMVLVALVLLALATWRITKRKGPGL